MENFHYCEKCDKSTEICSLCPERLCKYCENGFEPKTTYCTNCNNSFCDKHLHVLCTPYCKPGDHVCFNYNVKCDCCYLKK